MPGISVWGSSVQSGVIEVLADLAVMHDERDLAHLPTAHRAQPKADLRGQWLQGWQLGFHIAGIRQWQQTPLMAIFS